MEKTENYGLNQWDAQDAIKRTDFNADNAKIDAALGEHSTALNEHAAALALCGNCKIACGSYVGTGVYGETNQNSLTFAFEPKLLFVSGSAFAYSSGNSMTLTVLIYSEGASGYAHYTGNGNVGGVTTRTGKTIQWYGLAASATTGAGTQLNKSGETYYWIAIG